MASKASQATHYQYFQALHPGTSQKVSVGAASAQSTALSENTSVAYVFSTVDCFIKLGANPTAVADTSMFIPAGILVPIGVSDGPKIAVIRKATSGDLYITEGA